MRNRIITLFFIFSTLIMGLKIDDVDFNQEIFLGEVATKEFFLENKKTETLRYKFSIEETDENVHVRPTVLILKPGDRKSFKVIAEGNKTGEYRYFLVLQEEVINLEKSKKEMRVKMKYRLKQKYNVLEK